MDVHCECSDISKPIPHGAANRDIDRLDLDGQPEAIEAMRLRHVSPHRSQRAGNADFPSYRIHSGKASL